ncbi:MAG: hypothetical protein K2O46_03525, partial [Bacteroidales bacterium]|nr:hypothetical protein [Bacteroidales bacterium]
MDDYKENKVEVARRQIFGFAPLMDALPLRSAAARRAIWTLPWYGPAEAGALQAELARQRAYGALAQRADARALAHFKRHLEQTPDLRPTFRQLREERGALDDIQLFELKNWLLPMGESARFARTSGIDLAPLPDLEAALDLLDPLKERLPSFYIYDCYDERLPQLRRALKTAAEAEANADTALEARRTASAGEPVAGRENGADPCGGGSSINIEEQLSETELAVRENLSRRLRGFVDDLEAALDGLVAWDFLIAKTEWAEAQHCRCPEILTGAEAADAPALAYTGLFYPPLFQQCQAQGRPYQAVDIAL